LLPHGYLGTSKSLLYPVIGGEAPGLPQAVCCCGFMGFCFFMGTWYWIQNVSPNLSRGETPGCILQVVTCYRRWSSRYLKLSVLLSNCSCGFMGLWFSAELGRDLCIWFGSCWCAYFEQKLVPLYVLLRCSWWSQNIVTLLLAVLTLLL